MPLRSLMHFESRALDMTEALEDCDDHLAQFDVSEEDVVSLNVLESNDNSAHVVMVYCRYVAP